MRVYTGPLICVEDALLPSHGVWGIREGANLEGSEEGAIEGNPQPALNNGQAASRVNRGRL